MTDNRYPFVNPPLPYAYDALLPFIDEKTMRVHHDRHLQTYTDALNALIRENPHISRLTLGQMVSEPELIPQNIRTSVKNNAGGVYNHRFFFGGMRPNAVLTPPNPLKNAIDRDFGSFDNFKEQFKKAAASVFGSGYAWLALKDGRLYIVTTANQDNPAADGFCPILAIDVWEHAYYLKHLNRRPDYIEDWFNVADLDIANQRYKTCGFMQ